MRTFLTRLRGRKAKDAQDAIQRLDEHSVKGPEAARRFEDAARRIVSAAKPTPPKR